MGGELLQLQPWLLQMVNSLSTILHHCDGWQTIKNNDDLAIYLEENTIPGDKLVLTVERAKEQIPITITLGTRRQLPHKNIFFYFLF